MFFVSLPSGQFLADTEVLSRVLRTSLKGAIAHKPRSMCFFYSLSFRGKIIDSLAFFRAVAEGNLVVF